MHGVDLGGHGNSRFEFVAGFALNTVVHSISRLSGILRVIYIEHVLTEPQKEPSAAL